MPKSVRYTEEDLRNAAAQSYTIANVLRLLGIKQAGGSQSHIKKMLLRYNIDTSHFTGQASNKGLKAGNRRTADQILVQRQPHQLKEAVLALRRAMLESGVPLACKMCGLGVLWNNKPIVLEIDHIDEDFLNNRLENLQFLCPNCHSQKTAETRKLRLRIPKAEESGLDPE